MNSDELDKLRQQKASEEKSDELPEDDLKTPTIEELTFPGHQRVVKMIYLLHYKIEIILQDSKVLSHFFEFIIGNIEKYEQIFFPPKFCKIHKQV